MNDKPNGREKSELEKCNETIAALTMEIVQRQGVVDPVLFLGMLSVMQHQLETIVRMLVEGDENDPPILEAEEFNRRLNARCSAHLAQLRKPQIAVAKTIPQ